MNTLQLELKKLEIQEPYFIDKTNPYTDYCRDIVNPGTSKYFPEGAVGLRVSSDFWGVAAIPYKFRELSCKEIVDVLFPDARNPSYHADSGSIEQLQEYADHYDKTTKEVKNLYPDDPKQWKYYEELRDDFKKEIEKRKEANV